MKKWQPLLDRLLVKQDPAPGFFPAGLPGLTGLTIPDDQREKYRPHTGTVAAVGPGQWVNGTFCPVALQVGQHVMFAHPDTLTKVEHDGGEHLMLRESDIFLVLDEPKKRWQEASFTSNESGNVIITEIRDVPHPHLGGSGKDAPNLPAERASLAAIIADYKKTDAHSAKFSMLNEADMKTLTSLGCKAEPCVGHDEWLVTW